MDWSVEKVISFSNPKRSFLAMASETKDLPMFVISASMVAAIVGKHQYQSFESAMQKELEASRNKPVYDRLMEISGIRIPKVSQMAKNARLSVAETDTASRYAALETVSTEQHEKYQTEVASIGSCAVAREIGKSPPDQYSELKLDTGKIEKMLKHEVNGTLQCVRGEKQEVKAVADIASKGDDITHVTDGDEVVRIIIGSNDPPLMYDPSRELECLGHVDGASHLESRSGIRYAIAGRVDAWKDIGNGKKAIVEIKTRKNRLMEPLYDQVQMVCYMVIYRCNYCVLAQRLCGRTHESAVYEFNRFAELWQGVKIGLDAVVQSLVEAMTSKPLAIDFLKRIYPLIKTADADSSSNSDNGSGKTVVMPPEISSIFSSVEPVTKPAHRESIQIKLVHQDAKVPTHGTENSIGYDLYSCEAVVILPSKRALVDTGIQMAIPPIYSAEGGCHLVYGRIAPRSGLAWKNGIQVGAGVIDPDYRGNIKVLLFNLGEDSFSISPGDRVAQIIFELVSPIPICKVDNLSETSRIGGFGSTGK